MKSNKQNLIFWILIGIIFLLIIYLIYFTKTEAFECMNNPLVYGVNLYKDSQGEFTCTCSSPNSGINLSIP